MAGVGSAAKIITSGIPRLNEVLRKQKYQNPAMDIYLKEEYNNIIEKVAAEMKYTTKGIEKTEILYESEEEILDNENNEYIKIYNEFTELFDIKEIENKSKWILKITFNKYSLISNNITISTIQEIINEKGNSNNISYIFNDDNSSEIVLRININDSLSQDNNLNIIKDIENNLANMILKGIPDIKEIYKGNETNVLKFNLDGTNKTIKDSVLYTVGSNLEEVLKNDYVDTNRVYTNNINEIYEIFGVEAAREAIIIEMSSIYSDSSPNPKHIEMIGDIMTYRGKLMQIDRHGINRRR